MPDSQPNLRPTRLPFATALGAATLALAGCATATVGDPMTQQLGSAMLMKADGSPAGTARLVGHGDTVSLAIAATGLTPGEHGFHLHQTGQCKAPDFKSAGGHLNPYNRQHGLESPQGPHLGDLPNLVASASGTASTTVDLRGSQRDVLANIFDNDGTALVIHAGPDDYVTDPAGDAGSRVACGVFSRTAGES